MEPAIHCSVARPHVLDVPLGSVTRPSWRGRTHLFALLVVVPLMTFMCIRIGDGRARVGLLVYAVGLCSMLVASTTYHRWVHTVRWRAIWRRADHAMIFAAIAGTCTPLCLTLLATSSAIAALVGIWAAAAIGATIKLARWRRGDRVATAMYVANGWAGVLLVPTLARAGGFLPVFLLVFGGVVYTVGALGFARHWPTLKPTVFSYHEVWHLCTVTAAGAHLAAVLLVAT